MDLRKKIERDIRRKESEIQQLKGQQRGLELKIAEANAFVEALNGTLKHLPDSGVKSESPDTDLREGSKVALARDVLRESGQPLHIGAIVLGIGDPNDKGSRAALAGQLSSYVRQKRFFTRPKPNTFGLVEWSDKRPSAEVPDSFGEVT